MSTSLDAIKTMDRRCGRLTRNFKKVTFTLAISGISIVKGCETSPACLSLPFYLERFERAVERFNDPHCAQFSVGADRFMSSAFLNVCLFAITETTRSVVSELCVGTKPYRLFFATRLQCRPRKRSTPSSSLPAFEMISACHSGLGGG
jgi:hypothetical protein